MIDLIEQYRNNRSVGWNEIAEIYERETPIGLQQNANMGYCGVLLGLATMLRPNVIVEIGAQAGNSARMWLSATEPRNGTVHSIDIEPTCAELQLGPRWHFHLGRSQDIEPIECDLLYVDGDHSYDAVVSDMARHGTKVRDGGLVILDDYHPCWPGKTRWIDERWKMVDPILIGPTAVIRVTPEKRHWFAERFNP